ncbi:MAG: DUF2231 domain-containing protein [Nocardiopsaceae bacterium]|jgi:uncharacterized membrane protein|nr:DUF2231 domain-containing protein [Nocardiopsaceae bacterium]
MSNGLYEAKRPMTVLAGRYGHPLHPMLVTVPVGAWIASLVFDVASHIVAGPGFLSRGSEWLIAIGIIGALGAASVGMLDFYVIPAKTRAYRTVVTHMTLNLVVIAAFGFAFVWRLGQYHHPGPVPPAQLALSAAGLAFLAVSGHLGSKLAYRYGVRVADEETQGQGYISRAGRRAERRSLASAPAAPVMHSGHPAPVPPAAIHSRQASAAAGRSGQVPPTEWAGYFRPAQSSPHSRADAHWRRNPAPPFEESAS